MGKSKVHRSLDWQFNLPEDGEPMITFLPDKGFFESLRYLDNKRLGKQRVEAKMILDMLIGIGHDRAWSNHPAVGMWRGYESALGLYGSLAIREWMVRGFHNNMIPTYDFNNGYALNAPTSFGTAPEKLVPVAEIEYPPWLGNEELHASHRSNLLRKDFEYYKDFGWTDGVDIPYVWPKGKEIEELKPDSMPLSEAMIMLEGRRERGRIKIAAFYDRLVALMQNAQIAEDNTGYTLVRTEDFKALESIVMGEFEDKTRPIDGAEEEVGEPEEPEEAEEYVEGSGDLGISKDFNTVAKQGSLI